MGCRKSSRINISLATSGLIPLLVARLDHQDAIARLNLLKMIKVDLYFLASLTDLAILWFLDNGMLNLWGIL